MGKTLHDWVHDLESDWGDRHGATRRQVSSKTGPSRRTTCWVVGRQALGGAWRGHLALGSRPTSSPALVPAASQQTATLQDVTQDSDKPTLQGVAPSVTPIWELLSTCWHHIVITPRRPGAHAGSQRPLNLEASPKPSLCPKRQGSSWENSYPAQGPTTQRGQSGSLTRHRQTPLQQTTKQCSLPGKSESNGAPL